MARFQQLICLAVVSLCLIVQSAAADDLAVQGFNYVDPAGYYETVIPAQWVYQSQQSRERLVVFYGPGSNSVLYFERLDNVTYPDAEAFAEGSLLGLRGPGGLQELQIEKPIYNLDVNGKQAVAVVYSFLSSSRTRQWEQRVFVLLGEDQGFTLTLSEDEETFSVTSPVLDTVLDEWRWL